MKRANPLPSIAVIGAGLMGRQHARVISTSTQALLAGIVDTDATIANQVAEQFGCPSATSIDGIKDADAVVIATPTATHTSIAMEVIDAGLPLLVEKPIATTLDDTLSVLEHARSKDTPLLCGFVERFNPAIVTLGGLIDETIIHWLSHRHSPRNSRIQTGVAEDLLIHDLDLVLRFWGNSPTMISASSWTSPDSQLEEIVDVSLNFGDGIATLSANRWGQRKIRTFAIYTDSRLYEVDLLRQFITVYRSQRQEGDGASFREETLIDIPFIQHRGEPLSLQLDRFIELITGSDASEEIDSVIRPHLLLNQIADQTATSS